MLKLGYHVSISGGISNAFDYSKEINCTTMQIFIGSPRIWSVQKISTEEKNKFLIKSKNTKIEPVFVHMPYLPNLASPKEDVYKKSVETLSIIVKECAALKIEYVVVHLGSGLGEGKEKAIDRVVNAVSSVKSEKNGVFVLLENQAGQKNSVGSTLEDLKEIYDKIHSSEVGFCIDTCHLFAAGYDVRKTETAKLIDDKLGFENIKLIHLNDAKYELGSGRDRHECIGLGNIGIDGFKSFFSYKKFLGLNFILETPHSSKEQELNELKTVREILL